MSRRGYNPEREKFEDYLVDQLTEKGRAFPVTREQALANAQFIFYAIHKETQVKGIKWIEHLFSSFVSPGRKKSHSFYGGYRTKKSKLNRHLKNPSKVKYVERYRKLKSA